MHGEVACNQLRMCSDGKEPTLSMQKMTENFNETGNVEVVNAEFNAKTITEKKWKFKSVFLLTK